MSERIPSSPMSQWYVVHCQHFKEKIVATALTDHLGLTVYFPEVKRQFRQQMQPAPLFPSYLFVRANLEDAGPVSVNAIDAIPGVLRLVTFGGIPQPVPAAVIETLRKRTDELNNQGGLPNHPFQPGEVVRLTEGPFQGLEAIFIGPMKPSERVRVLIDFLGSLRDAKVDVCILESTKAAPSVKRERRTRGKGRHIKNAHQALAFQG